MAQRGLTKLPMSNSYFAKLFYLLLQYAMFAIFMSCNHVGIKIVPCHFMCECHRAKKKKKVSGDLASRAM